jgi:uracil-DNA glycosylase
MKQIRLSDSWLRHLEPEFKKEYMQELRSFLESEYEKNKTIFPKRSEYFNALNLVPIEQVKVVVLGQDPYHGDGEAHGLSFSVQEGVRIPPSLQNIFKELKSDLGLDPSPTGHLEKWAQQGVLLLNSVLTVEKDRAGSHQKRGWERFTDKIIEVINDQCDHVVFILWGAYAQKKATFVDRSKHLVIEGVHPSPLSAHRGFFGTRPFSRANEWLVKNNKKPVEWSLS